MVLQSIHNHVHGRCVQACACTSTHSPLHQQCQRVHTTMTCTVVHTLLPTHPTKNSLAYQNKSLKYTMWQTGTQGHTYIHTLRDTQTRLAQGTRHTQQAQSTPHNHTQLAQSTHSLGHIVTREREREREREIERERERERDTTHTHTHTHYDVLLYGKPFVSKLC